jgi:hypothetical protein
MTLTAITAHLSGMLTIITMVVVTVCNTVSLLPEGLPSYYILLWSAYDCRVSSEYCSLFKNDTITWPTQNYALRL